jgi:hypothetical protein
MMEWRNLVPIALCAALACPPVSAGASLPKLSVEHGATQLVIDGAPFLMLGAELENSSASSRTFMKDVWPKLAAMHVNTVLAPAYWEFIEPSEGKFDFSSIDGVIADARAHHMKVVFLWFGSWKNSMSSYAPGWVKRDVGRFPRVERSDGAGLEILSPMSAENLAADARAFAALMKHFKENDDAHTVVMVQVENEIGMIPEARDHSAAAEAAFKAPVPSALTDYLSKHKDRLVPTLRAAWDAHGDKVGAGWEETFGAGPATDEFFNAWVQAVYTEKVAAAGKAIYPLPMYVNAALMRPGRTPGQYPSGGPLPWLFGIWHAAAPSIDMLAPDIYMPNFTEWGLRYVYPGNPYFIPEMGRVPAAEMGANALWSYARLNAMGVSPYAPEFLSPDEQKVMASAFDLVEQLSPSILAAQGTDRIASVRVPTSYDGISDLEAQKFTFGHYTFDVHFKAPPPVSTGQKAEVPLPGAHGGLIIQIGPDEFLIAGTGMYLYPGTTGVADTIAGIETVDEGCFVDERWVPGRRLNGDETNQGRHIFVPAGRFSLVRLKLYHY